LKLKFQHIAKAALFLSVIVIAGIVNKNYPVNDIDDEFNDAPTSIAETTLFDFNDFDLEKETDETEKLTRQSVIYLIYSKSIISGDCPASRNYTLPSQKHIIISRIDLPPPSLL